jgi:GH43 family beta-xylosidase
MYVLEGTSQDPQGKYVFKGKIADSTDKWAIDGTMLTRANGSKYFIWSGWEGTALFISIYLITCMSKPSFYILQCYLLNRFSTALFTGVKHR